MPDIDKPEIDRRRLLTVLGTATASGFAGCGSGGGDGGATPTDGDGSDGDGGAGDGGDGDGGQTLGERVPTFAVGYFGTSGDRTAAMEAFLPGLKGDWEKLGLTVELSPVDTLALVRSLLSDKREYHAGLWGYITNPFNLDPNEFLMHYFPPNAGAVSQRNYAHYTNCEYADLMAQQNQASSIEERHQLLNEAQQTFTKDYPVASVLQDLRFTAARNDEAEVKDEGKLGMLPSNVKAYATADVPGGELIANLDPTGTENRNFFLAFSSIALNPWIYYVHSPLFYVNEQYERQPILARTLEVENGGRRFTVELKDGITFHNGDPVTAEDVQFTFQHVNNNAKETYPLPQQEPYSSIKIVDDRTVEFNFSEPNLSFVTLPLILLGILHKQTWVEGGAPEDPEGFQFQPPVGSGPFEVVDFQVGSHLNLRPADIDHPVWNPDHNITFQVFTEAQAALQAFRQGQINVINSLPPSNAFDMMEGDQFQVFTTEGVTGFTFQIQGSFGPTKFAEFRNAVGTAMNRERANQIAFNGESEPILAPLNISKNNPWRAPDDMITLFTDKPEGDIEAARQALEENGWGWDDDDNLHYPPDADLSPLWPKGETPAGDFPCIGPEGEYIPPDER